VGTVATFSGTWTNRQHDDIVALKHPSQDLYIFAVHDDNYTKMVGVDKDGARQDGRYVDGLRELDAKTVGTAWDKPMGKGISNSCYNLQIKHGAERSVPRSASRDGGYKLSTPIFSNLVKENFACAFEFCSVGGGASSQRMMVGGNGTGWVSILLESGRLM
jgi:hypothetical protein